MAAKATRLIALPGATLDMTEEMLMEGGRDVPLKIPCPSFLIEHPKGLVLFDTGLNPKAAVDPEGYLGAVSKIIKIHFSPELVVDSQIKQLGYKPADVKYVVVSHLHFDHGGGLALFPDAQFLIMKGELPYAYWPDRRSRAAFILDDLLPTRRFNWKELDGDTDLFDDGSMMMLRTDGHTPGECSLMVRLSHRSIVLTGDTVHLRAQLGTAAPMAVDWDRQRASDSIKRVKQIEDSGDARLWVSHDPADWAAFPHSPAFVE